MGKLFSDSPTIGMGKMGGSRSQDTSVGGGSRPTKSKIKIETSAPNEPHMLDRKPPNPLK
jgi:hypothetical protein